jgi:hypothetical protein
VVTSRKRRVCMENNEHYFERPSPDELRQPVARIDSGR